jgi:dTDP-4-dehydrorhamnose 3,5-epimerase
MKKTALKVEKINDVLVILNEKFQDERGVFLKLYNQKNFKEVGVSFAPKETFFSVSKKNVLRGMHFQSPPYDHDKLVSCIKGRALDVFVDLRKESKGYGKVYNLELTEDNAKTLFIPKGFAHGFLALSDDTIMLYEVSEGYNPDADKGINPLSIGFEWPVKSPIISARDMKHISFKDFKSEF